MRDEMENVIRNVVAGAMDASYPSKSGFTLARAIADEHERKTGNTCIVKRILDGTDTYDDRVREHFSFDIVEIFN